MAQPESGELSDLLQKIRQLSERRVALDQRLLKIEQSKASTAPSIYEKVRAETLQMLDDLAKDESGVRGQAIDLSQQFAASAGELEVRLSALNEELEEVRFRKTLGEYTDEDFQRIEQEKLSQLEAANAEMAPFAEARAVLEPFLGDGSGPADAASSGAAAAAAAAAAVPVAAEPAATAPESETPSPTDPVGTVPGGGGLPGLESQPSEISEMEALFGSSPSLPMPSPLPNEEEATTQDLGVRQTRPSGPGPLTGGVFRPVLIVRATKDQERGEDQYEMAQGQTFIGRAPENDIILLEESVSRRHARIQIEATECTFEDLGSANGSYLNGERIRPRQARKLRDNDVLKLGQLLALFRINPED